MTARTVTVLGATGSIGRSTLDLLTRAPDRYRVLALTAQTDVDGLAAAARATRAELAVIGDPRCEGALRAALSGTNIGMAAGPDAIVATAELDADWTMAAVVGCAGLRATLAALAGGRTVALANKEALVSAGEVMLAAARASGATLLPVDSEHNAVWQCLQGQHRAGLRRITLTASGGPFRSWSWAEMEAATPEQAVAHPNWSMGAKISVDSATLMNKGLELIEAAYLFDVGPDRLRALIHPQSVVHALVDFEDGSTLAQLGAPDMRVPIAATLAWPERMATPCAALDLATAGRLDFEEPDEERFPALGLARAAMIAGGARPAVLNAANEIAVAAFLARRIGFLDIASLVSDVLAAYDPPAPRDVDAVLAVDAEARGRAETALRSFSH